MFKEKFNFNRNLKTILGGLAISSVLSHQLLAADADDWRLRTQRYSTGAVSYVAKNFAALDVTLGASCQTSPALARQKVLDALSAIKQIAKTETPEVISATGNVNFDDKSTSRYSIAGQDEQPLQNKIQDACEKIFGVAASPALNQRVFSTQVKVRFQVTDKVAVISKLKQRISAYADSLKESAPAISLAVSVEQYSVDPAMLEQDKKALGEKSRLAKQPSRLTVDEKVFGGFSEKYVTSVEENPSPAFKSIQPTLDPQGNSVLEANYTFRVDYLPKNEVTNLPTKNPARGQLSKTISGKTIVPTDYYRADITISTTCHTSPDSAKTDLQPVYDKVMEKANAVANGDPLDYKNHVSIASAATPAADWNVYKEWSFKQNGQNSRFATSYISLCDGQEYKGNDTSKFPVVYALTQKFSITATSYKGLTGLQDFVAQLNEGAAEAGPRVVVANVSKLEPKLDDANQQSALEVVGYQNALEKLLNPNGELANALMDEIGASEAYYEFLSYEPLPKENNNDEAPQMMAMAAPGGARSLRRNQTGDVEVLDKNIPLERVAVFKEYTLQYRPKTDLVKVFEAKRKTATTTIKAPN